MKNHKAGKRPVLLLTNDDGVNAPGLNALIKSVLEFGNVVVIAPDKSQSGQSHSITVETPLYIKLHTDTEELKIYSTNGKPADCIKLALHSLKIEPDIILSGTNHGGNTSCSVIYSGTMAAAIEGCLNNIPSVGLSIDNYKPNANFDVVSENVSFIIKDVLSNGLPYQTCLNINFPDVAPDKFKGFKVCRQADGKWVEDFVERETPHGKKYYWLTGTFKNHELDAKDTDEWAIANNFASIVPVKIDFTARETLDLFCERYSHSTECV